MKGNVRRLSRGRRKARTNTSTRLGETSREGWASPKKSALEQLCRWQWIGRWPWTVRFWSDAKPVGAGDKEVRCAKWVMAGRRMDSSARLEIPRQDDV